MNKYIIPLLYMLVPFGFLSWGIVHQGHHITLLVFSVVCMALLIKDKWLKALIIYIVLWQLFILVTVMRFNLATQIIGSTFWFIMFLLASMVIYKAVCESKTSLHIYYNVICISAIVQTVIAISQRMAGIDPTLSLLRLFVPAYPQLSADTVCGSLGNPNFLAAYIAISLPFFFRKRWYYFLIPLSFVLFVSKSSSAVVPAIIGSAYYFGGIGLLLWAVIPCGAYLLWDNALSQLTDGSPESRGSIWFDAWKQIIYCKWSFIFGYGNAAGYGRPYPMHNEWLQVLHNYGLVGFSMLSGYVITISRKNKVLFTAFLIAAINMLGNYPLHLAPSAFLIIMIAGLIERERGNDGERER